MISPRHAIRLAVPWVGSTSGYRYLSTSKGLCQAAAHHDAVSASDEADVLQLRSRQIGTRLMIRIQASRSGLDAS